MLVWRIVLHSVNPWEMDHRYTSQKAVQREASAVPIGRFSAVTLWVKSRGARSIGIILRTWVIITSLGTTSCISCPGEMMYRRLYTYFVYYVPTILILMVASLLSFTEVFVYGPLYTLSLDSEYLLIRSSGWNYVAPALFFAASAGMVLWQRFLYRLYRDRSMLKRKSEVYVHKPSAQVRFKLALLRILLSEEETTRPVTRKRPEAFAVKDAPNEALYGDATSEGCTRFGCTGIFALLVFLIALFNVLDTATYTISLESEAAFMHTGAFYGWYHSFTKEDIDYVYTIHKKGIDKLGVRLKDKDDLVFTFKEPMHNRLVQQYLTDEWGMTIH